MDELSIFNDYKIEIKLKQITPMIHFQHDETGATLRASEVKPKLDKFIIKQLGGEANVPECYWLDKDRKGALDYKMQIRAEGTPTISNDRRNIIDDIIKKSESQYGEEDFRRLKQFCNNYKNNYKSYLEINATYFGNMLNDKKKSEIHQAVVDNNYDLFLSLLNGACKETVFHEKEIKVVIVSKFLNLIEIISANIIAFFLLHNFGTRQNKGFGSFKVTEIKGEAQEYDAKDFLWNHEFKDFFYIKYIKEDDKADITQKMNDVRLVYGFMKSGFNYTKKYDKTSRKMIDSNTPDDYFRGYIYRYFHNMTPPIGNDKAFVKQKVLFSQHQHDVQGEKIYSFNNKYRYVRGLLGVCNGVNYRSVNKNTFNQNFDGIARFASPILFKIVDDYIIILPQEIPLELYGAKFYIKDKKIEIDTKTSARERDEILAKNKKYLIKIPSDNEFTLYNFLKAFKCDFNDKDSKNKGGKISLNEIKNISLERAKTLIIKKAGDVND